jgi:NIMA (never in mitosis gene a)-related kinase
MFNHHLDFSLFFPQLPPTLSPNSQRRIIERFKRALFAPQSSSFNLKSEIKKVPSVHISLKDKNITRFYKLGPLLGEVR